MIHKPSAAPPLACRKYAERTCMDGFTLVEVVVALGILSLIMLATVTALRTFANTQGSIDRLTTRIDEMRTVSSFVRDLLETASTGGGGGGGGGLGLGMGGGAGAAGSAYFEGSASSVEWKAPVQFGESYGGTYIVQVAREKDSLTLRWQEPPGNGVAVEWTDSASRLLVENVDEFAVSYRANFRAPWQSEWKESGSPALVKLVLKASGRFWPELIMQVQR